jgi:hypothetical protein
MSHFDGRAKQTLLLAAEVLAEGNRRSTKLSHEIATARHASW